ncbi:MAG: thioredoxin family protein [Dehalococcoidales bacterium]|nr:thioredoxin family protein [Dehalococcoidales bacterium]
MNIKILGTGCAKCNQLEKLTKEVLVEMGIKADIDHVKDLNKIIEYPILTTPGLVINEELVVSGKVPDKAKLIQLVVNALDKEEKK